MRRLQIDARHPHGALLRGIFAMPAIAAAQIQHALSPQAAGRAAAAGAIRPRRTVPVGCGTSLHIPEKSLAIVFVDRHEVLLRLFAAPVGHATALIFRKTAMAVNVEPVERRVQRPEFLVGQFDVPCAQVFEDALLILQAGDWEQRSDIYAASA